jgi:hypothetical protein
MDVEKNVEGVERVGDVVTMKERLHSTCNEQEAWRSTGQKKKVGSRPDRKNDENSPTANPQPSLQYPG